MEGTNNTSGFFYSYKSTWGKSEVYPRKCNRAFPKQERRGVPEFLTFYGPIQYYHRNHV